MGIRWIREHFCCHHKFSLDFVNWKIDVANMNHHTQSEQPPYTHKHIHRANNLRDWLNTSIRCCCSVSFFLFQRKLNAQLLLCVRLLTAHTFWHCQTLIFYFFSCLIICSIKCILFLFIIKGFLYRIFYMKRNSLEILAKKLKFYGFEFRFIGISEEGSCVINLLINFFLSFQSYFPINESKFHINGECFVPVLM